MKMTSLVLAVSLAALFSAALVPALLLLAAPEAAAPAAEVEETQVAEGSDLGKKVYGNVCAMCHAAGVAGAPKPGDKADWGPRIAQGMDTLHKHALEGFTGAKGMMPARGGSTTLSDDDVKAAVDFMVAQSK